MGYRSNGKIWLDEEAKKLLSKELLDDLENDWTKEEENVWSFMGWKWYSGYDIINRWEEFLDLLVEKEMDEHYDFARVGEEYEDVDIRTYNKFNINRTIEVWA